MNHFEKVRFYLFVNSYSGKTIAQHLREKYKKGKLSKTIKRLSQVLGFSRKQLESFIMQDIGPAHPYQRIPLRISIYLEVESELTKLTEERLDEYSTAKEDYQNPLLLPAIERTAGNSLSNVISDGEFQEKLQEKIRKYISVYYKVAYKYKLPTIRIVPFVLRVIS